MTNFEFSSTIIGKVSNLSGRFSRYRVRESNHNTSNKRFAKSAGFVYFIFELRMGPLESRNNLVITIFAMIFTLDESFTLKFHFEKSRPGRAATEQQLGQPCTRLGCTPRAPSRGSGSPNQVLTHAARRARGCKAAK